MAATHSAFPIDRDAEEDVDALLRLVLAGGRTRVRGELLERHGTASRAMAAGNAAWRDAGLDPRQSAALRQPDVESLEHARAWLAVPGHQLIGWTHADYPPPRIIFGRFLVSGGWLFASGLAPRWIARVRNKRLRRALWRAEYRLSVHRSTYELRTFPAIIPLIRRRRAPVARV